MEDLILYDWLSFSCKFSDPWLVVDYLGMRDCPWDCVKGARGYKNRLYFNCISIHFDGRDDMGVWCEMSGQGCRAFETLSTLENGWTNLFNTIAQFNFNITRLDVAYDDHKGRLDINRIIQDTRAHEYVSKSDYWEIVESAKGQTVQFGSPKSDVLIRIYDKAAERHCETGTHWIRCELQLRRERAIKFTQLAVPLGEAMCGVIINYLRFVEPDELDTNRWRWALKDYWGDFLMNAAAISIYESPGMEYNFDRCENYVIRQAGNAIDAYIQIRGFDGFIDALKNRRTLRNPKYDKLVENYRHFYGA